MALTSLHDLPAWKKNKCESERQGDIQCEHRVGHNSVCIKEELLVWGGYHSEEVYQYTDQKYIWSFNLDLDRWVKLKPVGKIPSNRSGASSGLIWPKWYIFGGHGNQSNLNDVVCLDLITLTWERLEVPTEGPAAVSPRDKCSSWVSDDRFYIFGGFGVFPYSYLWDRETDEFTCDYETGRGWNNQLMYLDLTQKCWVQPKCKGKKPTSRAAHASVNMNDQVYIFGGRHDTDRMNDLHCLHLDTHTWSGELVCTGTPPEGRTWHSMSRVSPSQILVYGGYNSRQRPLDDVWILDIDVLSWSQLCPSTGLPRLWHTAATNHHGDVLVFGGCVNDILDHNDTMRTSDKVLVLRKNPFTLNRLCLHQVFRQRDLLRSYWNMLPKYFTDWLEEKLSQEENSKFLDRPAFVVNATGPSLSQLNVRTEIISKT